MSTRPDIGEPPHLSPSRACRAVPFAEVDNPILQDGISLWRQLAGESPYPARADVTARVLKPLLRNTTLLKVIDGGRDYEYRVVGDAFVMAHGISFQGKRWSETAALSPGFHHFIKPVYDSVVASGLPVATRGWIERGAGSNGYVYCEYVYLPLGTVQTGIDHILAFAVYLRRDGIDHIASNVTGSFAD